MGVEKGKKLPTRLNKHNKNRLDKHSNKVKKGGPKGGEGKKRKEKEPNNRKKLEKEDDMFDHEQDTNGFFKVPKDVRF